MTEEQVRKIIADFVGGYISGTDIMRRKFARNLLKILGLNLVWFGVVAFAYRQIFGDTIGGVLCGVVVIGVLLAAQNQSKTSA